MRYISTRGQAPEAGFEEALLTGLAPDGGLYMPAAWPVFSPAELRDLRALSWTDAAVRIMRPFMAGSPLADDLPQLAEQAFASSAHPAVCPLKQLGPDLWVMELFHGPTLAFKDVALQLLGRLFDAALTRRGRRATVIGATSGDTGSAAIAACRDRQAVDIFILHPEGRVSEVQRRQMTTVDAANVHNIALKGSFDDCQDIVKALFNDAAFRQESGLAAVNSINWARIMAQTVYYVQAALQLGAPDRAVSFSVPSGNFGNVFAAWAARAMGLPVRRLVVGSNRNDILTRFFDDNDMSLRAVEPSLSPSMDIQISSNFERLLFELLDRDGAAAAAAMQAFRRDGRLPLDGERWRRASSLFSARRLDDPQTLDAIRTVYDTTGELLDPHTAIGVMAAMQTRPEPDVPLVCMATAHPAKFPDAVTRATGQAAPLPPRLAHLFDSQERMTILPNSVEAVRQHIRRHRRTEG